MLERIEYDALCRQYSRDDVDEVVELLTDTLCTTRSTLRVGGEDIPRKEGGYEMVSGHRRIGHCGAEKGGAGGYGFVFGTFFVCGIGEEDFVSLSPAQAEHYKKHFYKAEILLAINGNEPVTMKVPPLEKGKPAKVKSRDTPPERG